MTVRSHGGARRAIVSPGESRIDHAAARHERRAVALVEGQIVAGLQLVAEHGRIPVEIADDGLGVRIEQELVRIETVAVGGLIRPVDTIAVDGTGARIGQKAMPDLVGEFGQLDALDLALAADRRKGTARLWWRAPRKGEVDA